MSHIKTFDNFFLPASDLPTAKDFYQNQLGLEIKFDFSEKGMVAFKVGKSEPAIILTNVIHAKPAIWFTVDNVQEAYEVLKSKGLNFLSEPFEIMTGMSVEFLDPFGNKLGLTDYTKSAARSSSE